jgi:hypothetical protein
MVTTATRPLTVEEFRHLPEGNVVSPSLFALLANTNFAWRT